MQRTPAAWREWRFRSREKGDHAAVSKERVHPDIKPNDLASPPLVLSYANR